MKVESVIINPLVHSVVAPGQVSILAVLAGVCKQILCDQATILLKRPGVLAVEAEHVDARIGVLLLDDVAPVDVGAPADPLHD